MSRPSRDPVRTQTPKPARWQQLLRDAIRNADELLAILGLDPQMGDSIQPSPSDFPLLVPRGFVARMRRGNPDDPLLRQVLPRSVERDKRLGFTKDPLREKPLVRHGIIEKYPSRALIVTTAACPVHCRYCFRRHFSYESQSASRSNWADIIATLETRDNTREIILSGGDPLSLSNHRLQHLISELETIPALASLRIHSRFPIVLPERVDQGLIALLRQTRLKTVLVVHCNHANEIDESVQQALEDVSATGTLLLNQSVLLRGINDDVGRLEALSNKLFDAGILPYYLHQLDRVAGTAHYEVTDKKASALITALRARIPGYLVPRLVREVPGELSKTPLGRSHL